MVWTKHAVALCVASVLALVALTVVSRHGGENASKHELFAATNEVSNLRLSEKHLKARDSQAMSFIKEIDESEAKARKKADAKKLARAEKKAKMAVNAELKALDHNDQSKLKLVDSSTSLVGGKKVSSKANALAVAEAKVDLADAQVKVAEKAAHIVTSRVKAEAKEALRDQSDAKERVEEAGMYRRSAAQLRKKSAALKLKAEKLSEKLEKLKEAEKRRKDLAVKAEMKFQHVAKKAKLAEAALKAEEKKAATIRAARIAHEHEASALAHAEDQLKSAAEKHKILVNRAKGGVDSAHTAISVQERRVKEKEREAYNDDVENNPLYNEV